MTETSTATFTDALDILTNVSEQTAADFRALGLDAEGALRAVLRRLPDPDAVSIRIGGELLAILGWDKYRNDWYSWFIAKPGWFDMRPSILKASRRVMAETAGLHPGATLFTVPMRNDPAVVKWLRAMGFKRDGRAADMMRYRYWG